ncbi:MAG: MptD family putative ECF transporter S component [Oscillospiraceae bacterium]|nr:MptD family putative ECF transporter S component [Oscillospiraceae bacterium]
MAKKEITVSTESRDKKLRTKDLIFAGAFGAIYIVLMLIVVMAFGMVPVLYILTPLPVGILCATVYELCVLKVHKFGAALILGVLFAVTASSGYLPGFVLAIAAALLAELVIMAGKYKSKKMFLLSYIVFNLNMVCPFTNLYFNRASFMSMATEYYGEDYANGVAALAVSWLPFAQIGLAMAGAAIGVLISSALIRKHFEKAGIM